MALDLTTISAAEKRFIADTATLLASNNDAVARKSLPLLQEILSDMIRVQAVLDSAAADINSSAATIEALLAGQTP